MLRKNVTIVSLILLLLFFVVIVSFADSKETISINPVEKHIYTNRTFQVLVKVNKDKGENPYCFFPPEFEMKSDDLSLDVKKMTTNETKDNVSLEVLIEGIAKKAGDFEIGPIKIPYTLTSEGFESEFVKDNTRVLPTAYWDIPAVQVKVEDEQWAKYRRYSLLGGSIFCIIIISCVSWLWYAKRRPQQTVSSEPTSRESLHEARKYRLDGNYYEYFRTLYGVAEKIYGRKKQLELANLMKRIKEKMNEVGYKGVKPTEAEMDGFWKEVEKYLSEEENERK
ncbi:MAG TPA: BatD family protein [Candidatus Hydrogenedens sp.]|nr:BatD family protein [Candidatus Hydrogenedens sp.]